MSTTMAGGVGTDSTTAELMAVTIARELVDGETVAVGSVSPIPASACLLAKRTHAPRGRFILLGSGAFPFDGGMQEFYNFAMRGRIDVFFSSGAQIDQHGNFNLSAIGDYAHPKVRLPGGRALGVLAFVMKRLILFRTDHSRRVFVPQVDFVTAPATGPDRVYRRGGVSLVVTDLAMLRFSNERKRLELESVHPGVRVDDVQARTGFPLNGPIPAPVTVPPTPSELALLRGEVRDELASIYPQFVARQSGRAG